MNELITLMSIQSVYAWKGYKKTEEIPHIIMCGKFNVETLYNFSNEIFHNDHGNIDKNAVIIDTKNPDLKMEKFLNDQRFEFFLTYIMGDPQNDIQLEKAQIMLAESVAKTNIIYLNSLISE